MDNLILEGIVAELRPRLTGSPVYRISWPGPDSLVLGFDDPGRSRLLLSAAPGLPRFHLTREKLPRREGALSGFVASAAHHLTGAILAAIEKDPWERVVRLRFAGPSGRGKSLIAELLGRSSNLLLTDTDEKILGFTRRLKSAFRAPLLGALYVPPTRLRCLDPRSLTEAAVHDLLVRSRAESHPLADLLLEACPALGPLAAREIERRATAGEPPFRVLAEWLGRVFEGPNALNAPGAPSVPNAASALTVPSTPSAEVQPTSGPRAIPVGPTSIAVPSFLEQGPPEVPKRPPVMPAEARVEAVNHGQGSARSGPAAAAAFVYAEGPLDRLDLRTAPGPGRLLLSPLPLLSAAPDLAALAYSSLNEAADGFYSALSRGRAFRDRRDGLVAMARREAKRSEEISAKVARDLEGMERAEPFRAYGEALLAGMTRAERRGAEVLVPDPYAVDERTLAVPIDPSISLSANAERYFSRYRKAQRGRGLAKTRLLSQSRRLELFADLAVRIEKAECEADFDEAEAALRGLGVAVGLERRRRGQSEPRASGVRIYQSSEGYEILVGRGAEENDRLTFKIAGPEDFWLHASGASGAHVVVRNPRAEARLPAATLRQAAELAAFFSKAKNAGRAEVLVTRRKYVRRVRGGPRGTVTVKKGESIPVSPRNPFE